MLSISIVANNSEKGIFISNSLFTFFNSLRLKQIITNLDSLYENLIKYKVDLLIFDMELNYEIEKNLLVFLNNKLFKNTDIFFITKNKYNINFINNIYFILPEKRTEKYYTKMVITKNK